MPYQKVLVAVDDSEASMKAAEHGVHLSLQLGAKLAVVFVIDTTKVNADTESGALVQDQVAMLKIEAGGTLDRIAKKFPESVFERFIPEGKPSQGIVDIAKDWEADLIVMGTRGKTGLKRLLLGSTAENIIRLSNMPILVVPTKT